APDPTVDPAESPAAETEAPAPDEAPAAEVPPVAPARRSRRATASTEEVAALAVELPAESADPQRSREEIAAELDSLLPDVTSGNEGDGEEATGRGRNRNRNRNQRG